MFGDILVSIVSGLMLAAILGLVGYLWRRKEKKAPASGQLYLAVLKPVVMRKPPDWFIKAEKLLRSEKYLRAVSLFRSGLKRGLSAQNRMVAHGKIGFAYYRFGDYEASLREYTKCHRFAENIANDEVVAHAAKSMGDALHRIGKPEESRQSYEEALDIYKRKKLRRYEIDADAAIGQLILNQGDIKGAKKRFERKLNYNFVRGLDLGVADARENLGVLHQRTGSFRRAKSNLRIAGRIYRKHGLIGPSLAVKNTLAAIYQAEGEHSKALGEYQEILDKARRCDFFIFEGFALQNIASVQVDMGEYEDAELNALAALGAFGRAKYALGKARSLGLLGLIERHKGNTEEAERLHQKMLRVAETADLAIDRIVATRQLLIDQEVLEKSHKNDGIGGG